MIIMPPALDLDVDLSKIDLQRQLDAIDRVDCEESLYTFLLHAWPHMDPAPFKGNWHIQAIAEHLQAVVDGEIKRLIINVPPRSTKTSLCSVALPAWTWAQPESGPTSGPGVRFMYVSYGEELSLEHSVYCRRLIKSEWYQHHWGDRYELLSDQDTKHKFANDKGGERQITSIGARVTGRGAQIVIIDDPNATNEALSDPKTKEVRDYWDQTLRSRLNDRNTGAFVLIQQRVAEGDLTGHILEKDPDEWEHLMIPAEYEPDRSFKTSIGWEDPRKEAGEILCSERFDADFIAREKKNKWVFAGQYQQRPEPLGGGIIKREWWQLWEPKAYPPMDYILASLDTAYTVKTENDYSALTLWGVFTTDTTAVAHRTIDAEGRPVYIDRDYNETAPKVMLLYAWAERLEFHDLIQKVAATCTMPYMRADKLLVENKAAGISIAQEMKRLFGNEQFSIQLADPKSMDKMARLFSVQHLFEESMVYAPDKVWAEQVITQVGQFPRGRHDDLVDTVSQAIRHLRDIGLLTRAAERADEIKGALTYPRGDQMAPLYPS